VNTSIIAIPIKSVILIFQQQKLVMAFLKYLFELIVIFYIVRIGIRFIDNLLRPSIEKNKDPKSTQKKWQGGSQSQTQNQPRPTQKDEDYIDYEEIK
jgi:hypothetical protein